MTGTITTCECWVCGQYEQVKCDACGTPIIPIHDMTRVYGDGKAADLCRGCLGAGFGDQIDAAIASVAARDAAERTADLAYQAARDDAEAAFWAATASHLAAYDTAIAAARQQYKDATGQDCRRHDGLHHTNPGCPGVPF